MPAFRLPFTLTLACLLLAACATQPAPSSSPAATESAAPVARWDSTRESLRNALGNIPGIIVEDLDEDVLRVRIPATDGFAIGQSTLRPGLVDTLERLLPVFQAHPDAAIDIVGHTDSVGNEMFNLRLSIARAEAVMEHLRSHGIALLRLTADGLGEAEPIADNATQAGREANRRVEILLRALR